MPTTLGKFTVNLRQDSTATSRSPADTVSAEIFVVENLKCALLGRPEIEALGVFQPPANLLITSAYADIQSSLYPSLFSGLGTPLTIKLRDDAQSYSLSTPRRIPLPLEPKVVDALQTLQSQGTTRRVDEPTDWCAGLVVVPYPTMMSGFVGISPAWTKQSSENATSCPPRTVSWLSSEMRSVSPSSTPTVASTKSLQHPLLSCSLPSSHQQEGSAIRACLSVSPLHRSISKSRCLTSWQTYAEQCAWSMISSPLAPLRKRKTGIWRLPWHALHADNGVTLNSPKCSFHTTAGTFLGHVIDQEGIRPHPAKITALRDMPPCHDVSAVQSFLGMAAHLGKFIPDLSKISQPLRRCWSRMLSEIGRLLNSQPSMQSK